ncbi:MAG: hypothetical protein PUB96_06645 [Helicobacteraceae bacterium]|nr:hypothetical protein [Helicobacteraceae bacterium]
MNISNNSNNFFNNASNFNNLNSITSNLSGKMKITQETIMGNNELNLAEKYKEKFNKLYNSYIKNKEMQGGKGFKGFDSISADYALVEIKDEFKRLTGLEFSENKMLEIKEKLDNATNSDEIFSLMPDLDSVVGMKLEKNGQITLKFNSGRTIQIEELYSDTGELHFNKKGERAALNLESKNLDEESLNNLDFSELGILKDGDVVSLEEIGAEMIRKIHSGDKFLGFAIMLKGDRENLVVQDLFNIYTLNFLNKNRSVDIKA